MLSYNWARSFQDSFVNKKIDKFIGTLEVQIVLKPTCQRKVFFYWTLRNVRHSLVLTLAYNFNHQLFGQMFKLLTVDNVLVIGFTHNEFQATFLKKKNITYSSGLLYHNENIEMIVFLILLFTKYKYK